jgi:hypothetical protein
MEHTTKALSGHLNQRLGRRMQVQGLLRTLCSKRQKHWRALCKRGQEQEPQI